MDNYASKIDHDGSIESRKALRQQEIHNALFRKQTIKAYHFLARCFYEADIPIDAISHDNFEDFCEVIDQFGLDKASSQFKRTFEEWDREN